MAQQDQKYTFSIKNIFVNSRPIPISPVLSYVSERSVSIWLRRFIALSGELPTAQFIHRIGLGNYDALTGSSDFVG